jgi:hypothetical protein
MSENSKDTIKTRMIKNASGIWGYPDVQDISSFDPIVGMLIGSLTEEIYNIYEEIKRTDARIVEKLFDLLINQETFNQFPAHAIARAKPTQPQITVSELNQFIFQKKIIVKNDEETAYSNKNIYFTPASEMKLFRGEVKYFAAANQFFEIRDSAKESLAIADTKILPDHSRLYIGLKLEANIEKFDGLSFLLTVKNKQNEERFSSLLSGSRWKINKTGIEVKQGFELYNDRKLTSLGEILRKESDISFRACSFINEFYRRKFMTIENRNYFLKNYIKPDPLPEELKNRFSSNVLKSIPRDIFWIEIQLSQPVAPDMLNELTVLINCFPVINRELNELSQMLNRGINIIPLTSEDLFFDIKDVTDTEGTVYKQVSSLRNGHDDDSVYMIRQSGIARFDSRDSKETINHLIDLIRDERAGFALLGTDLISSELKQLDQIISRLKQRMESSNISDDSNSYLMLNTKSDFERAAVQFWTTSGELANNIRSGSKLTIHHGTDIDPNSVTLLTNTYGGRQKPSREDKLNKLRRMLLSKGRIVTTEDIRALCFEHFGNELSDVEVKKGVYLDPSPEKGLVRSVDIFLTFGVQNKLPENELEHKTEELKIRLMQESINLLPFRIFSR